MDESQGVIAEATAVESPTTEQPVTEATESTTVQPEVEDTKTVPYERFKEVNDSLRELKNQYKTIETRLPQPAQPKVDPEIEQAKKALASLGYAPKEDVVKEIRAELLREREDMQMAQTLSTLEDKYSGKDGMPKFSRTQVIDFAIKNEIGNPEVAYKQLNEKAIIDWHIKSAIASSKGTKSEGSDGSGSQGVGTTDEDLRQAVAKGDSGARKLLLKRIAGNYLRKNL